MNEKLTGSYRLFWKRAGASGFTVFIPQLEFDIADNDVWKMVTGRAKVLGDYITILVVVMRDRPHG
jgi:hypothetical protein